MRVLVRITRPEAELHIRANDAPRATVHHKIALIVIMLPEARHTGAASFGEPVRLWTQFPLVPSHHFPNETANESSQELLAATSERTSSAELCASGLDQRTTLNLCIRGHRFKASERPSGYRSSRWLMTHHDTLCVCSLDVVNSCWVTLIPGALLGMVGTRVTTH